VFIVDDVVADRKAECSSCRQYRAAARLHSSDRMDGRACSAQSRSAKNGWSGDECLCRARFSSSFLPCPFSRLLSCPFLVEPNTAYGRS
jgi:hypothetical protein